MTAIKLIFLVFSLNKDFWLNTFSSFQVKITAYACSLRHRAWQETSSLVHTDFSLTLILELIQDYSEKENEREGEYILGHVV